MNIAMKFYDSTWPSPQKYREIIPSLFALCFINSNELKTYTNIHSPGVNNRWNQWSENQPINW